MIKNKLLDGYDPITAALPMNRLYHDPKDSPALAEKHNYVNLTEEQILRFWSYVDSSGGIDSCWKWKKGINVNGYGSMSIKGKNKQTRNLIASRVSYQLTYGPFPLHLFVCHVCDNRLCCNPKHLFLGDHKANMADMVKKLRTATGDRNPSRRFPEKLHRGEQVKCSKLTDQLVLKMRKEYPSVNSYRVIAKKYGVTTMAAFFAINKRTWKHVI